MLVTLVFTDMMTSLYETSKGFWPLQLTHKLPNIEMRSLAISKQDNTSQIMALLAASIPPYNYLLKSCRARAVIFRGGGGGLFLSSLDSGENGEERIKRPAAAKEEQIWL